MVLSVVGKYVVTDGPPAVLHQLHTVRANHNRAAANVIVTNLDSDCFIVALNYGKVAAGQAGQNSAAAVVRFSCFELHCCGGLFVVHGAKIRNLFRYANFFVACRFAQFAK